MQMSTQIVILLCFILYTALLFVVMWLSSRRSAGNDAFFRGNRKSPWPVVAYGMLGASLSGVTFMSVPGGVYHGAFTYMPLVFGYVIGYFVIAFLLLPLYYKLSLTSIYSYLEQRFGGTSERTGAIFFILSRLLGSALRMYLVVFVLYELVFRSWGIPFWVPAVVFIALILLYTFRGGVKTVVWTDTLQTTFLLLAAIATVVVILKSLDISIPQLLAASSDEGYTRIFETDINHPKYYWKQIVSGAFITIAMTGLDQDMMQKNLTCKSLRDAQKNVITSSFLFIIVNIIFLTLGAALIYYGMHTPGFEFPVDANGVVVGDKIYPLIAQSMGGFVLICFILGMIAAGYSSADGTLTALTATFCYDFLHFDRRNDLDEQRKVRIRKLTHVAFALLYLLVIMAFRPFHNDSLINILFDIAGYTYGPLLGLYAFGLFTRRRVHDRLVPVVAIASPVLCYLLKIYSVDLFGGYQLGFELLLLNGLITFLGLLLISRKELLAILPLLLLLSGCSSYKVYSVKDKPTLPVRGGVVYALPRTQIKVAVTIERRDLVTAPYACFAADMLGATEADIDTSFRIVDIDVQPHNIADPDHFYFVKLRRGSVTVDERHLLLAVGMENGERKAENGKRRTGNGERRTESGERRAENAVSYNLYDRADTFYTRYDSPGHPSLVISKKDVRTLRQRAEEAAERIGELQDKQRELLAGETDGIADMATMRFVLAQLQRQEFELKALFLGETHRETVYFYVDPRADKTGGFVDTVIWFSPSEGLISVDEQETQAFKQSNAFTGGPPVLPNQALNQSSNPPFPIVCTVQSARSLQGATRFVRYHTSGASTLSADRSGRAAHRSRARKTFRYRIPELATVGVMTPQFSLSRQLPISQFGPIVELPRRRVKALFDPETLDLREVRSEK